MSEARPTPPVPEVFLPTPPNANTVSIDEYVPTVHESLPEDAQRYLQRSKWKEVIEAELQDLISQAAGIRVQITSAKTFTKRQYYNKKFKKINAGVMQMVVSLQRLDHLEQAQMERELAEAAELAVIADSEVANVVTN